MTFWLDHRCLLASLPVWLGAASQVELPVNLTGDLTPTLQPAGATRSTSHPHSPAGEPAQRRRGVAHPDVLVDHARRQATNGGGGDGRAQRLDDAEQLAILGLLEAASTERSALRAARALAELMGRLHALGQRIATELPDRDRDGNPAGPQMRWVSSIKQRQRFNAWRCCYEVPYGIKAGPAGGLRPPSGPAASAGFH